MSDHVVTRLSWFEVYLAAQSGALRRIEGMKRGRVEKWNVDKGGGWDRDICGAAAELAVAKTLDRFWNPVVSDLLDLDGDVSTIQIRWTSRGDGRLILHPEDDDSAPFVLVVGELPTLAIAGWIYGAEGKRDDLWTTFTGRPCYMVPQSELRSLDQLVTARI